LQPLGAQRSGQIATTQWHTNISRQLLVDPSAVARTPEPNHKWWLQHRAEGLPNDYAPLQADADGETMFELDLPAVSGQSTFRLVYGPALLPNVELYAANCTSNSQGEVRIAAAALHFPVRYAVYDDADVRLASGELTDAESAAYVQLSAGDYRLDLEDAEGEQFSESWFFQASDAPALGLETAYYVAEGERLELSFPLADDVSLHWERVGEASSNSEVRTSSFAGQSDAEIYRSGSTEVQFSTTTPGVYTLTALREGCEARHRLEVLRLRNSDNIADLQLWPNPSPDGFFNLQADLHQAADAEVVVVLSLIHISEPTRPY